MAPTLDAVAVITVVDSDFCPSCKPEYFPDAPQGPLHWSTRWPNGRSPLHYLEPIATDRGPLIHLTDLKLGPGGKLMVLAAICEEGTHHRHRRCHCGSNELAMQLLTAPWARISFSGPRQPKD